MRWITRARFELYGQLWGSIGLTAGFDATQIGRAFLLGMW